MYVRLAFAVAAHLEPEILIVDEVLAVGDAEFQKKCLGKMEDVASRDGRTVLFVSHNAAAMRTLCTHGILMTGGKASPKQDIVSTLDLYSLTNQLATSSTTWTWPVGADARNVRFETIDISIQGTQPRIRLRCTTEIKFENSGRRVAIAIDLHAGNSVVIIQAIPYEQPFIGGESGT